MNENKRTWKEAPLLNKLVFILFSVILVGIVIYTGI